MFIKAGDKNSKRAKVYDSMNKPVPLVYSYNTKTKVAVVYLGTKENGVYRLVVRSKGKSGEVVKVRVKLPGSYLKIDDKIVK